MKKLMYSLVILSLLVMSCTKESSRDNDSGSKKSTSIPADSKAGAPPTIDYNNINIPNAVFYTSNEVKNIISINMTGIKDPTTGDFIDLAGTSKIDQTVWLQVDGTNKGILISEASSKSGKLLQADIVFLVDNSGSMDQEADTIASQISAFVELLDQTLDLQVGCVGYDVSGNVSGALDLDDADSLVYYLNDRPGYTYGTNRTEGFTESTLASTAYTYATEIYDENGMVALRFADENFTFRPTANKIYINFTDEANQTDAVGSDWSVESLLTDWNVNQGTVHTVFSDDTLYYASNWDYSELNERPWLMSEYTGGSSLFILSNASDLDLTTLPVTGALAESIEIQFVNNSTVADGSHEVIIFVENADGSADGSKTYSNVSFTAK